jgi:hypothetical protein
MNYPSDKKSRTKNLLTGGKHDDNEPLGPTYLDSLTPVRESKYVGHDIRIARDN